MNSKVVYKNPWMEVREDKVITPAGKRATYGNITLRAGVSVLALDERRNVYLVREYHYGIDKFTLETVNGGQEKGQTPLQAAKAELLEEAGLKAKKWTILGEAQAFGTYLSAPLRMYLAEELSQHESQLEETETIEVVKMPLTKALRLVDKGVIDHFSTVIALYKVSALKKVR